MELTLDQAKHLLSLAVREELRDHAFGDAEVYWYAIFDGKKIELACGYFGDSKYTGVSVYNPRRMADSSIDESERYETVGEFKGEEARQLRECGKIGHIERNDETGPETYTEGDIMPGLSLGDVFHELTGSYLDGS